MMKSAKYQSMQSMSFAMACTNRSYDDLAKATHRHPDDPGELVYDDDPNADFPLPFERSYYATPTYPALSVGPIKHPSIGPTSILIRTTLPAFKGIPNQTNNLITFAIFLCRAAKDKEQTTKTSIPVDLAEPIPAGTTVIIFKPEDNHVDEEAPPTTSPQQRPQHLIKIIFKTSEDANKTTAQLDKLDISWTNVPPRSILGKLFGFRRFTKDEEIQKAMKPYRAVAPSLRVKRHVHSKEVPILLDDCYFSVDEHEFTKLQEVDPSKSTTMHRISWSQWVKPTKLERNCSHCKKSTHGKGRCPHEATQNDVPGCRHACGSCGSFKHNKCKQKPIKCTACGSPQHSFYNCIYTCGTYKKFKVSQSSKRQNAQASNQLQTGIPKPHNGPRVFWSLKSYANATAPKIKLKQAEATPVQPEDDVKAMLIKLELQLEVITQKLEQKEIQIQDQQERITALEQMLEQQHKSNPTPFEAPVEAPATIQPIILSPAPRSNNSGAAPQHPAPITIANYFNALSTGNKATKAALPATPKSKSTTTAPSKSSGKRKQSTSSADPQSQKKKTSPAIEIHPDEDDMTDDPEEHKHTNDKSTPGNPRDITKMKKRLRIGINDDDDEEEHKSEQTAHETCAQQDDDAG
jgi:hypothetical protein